MLIAALIIVAALVLGLLANQLIRRRAEDDDAPSRKDMTSPIETLAVLVLAFVLVAAAESFNEADEAATAEAGVVDHMFETADYLPDPLRERLQAGTVCYARAVGHLEWPEMAKGHSSSAPSVWTTGFRETFKSMADKQDSLFEMLVQADKERSAKRQARIAEASPSIPDAVFWFMALTLALTVGGFAYSIPVRRNLFHILAIATTVVLFIASLLVINDVDEPFSGAIAVDSEQITYTATDLTEDFVASFGAGRLPCDEQGNPAPAG